MKNPNLWWLPILLYLFTAYIFVRIIQKRIVGLHSRTKRLAIQFLCCLAVAIVWAHMTRSMGFERAMSIVFLIGFANGFACYLQWKAVDISLTKSSLFTFLDDIIAMVLSYFVIGEKNMVADWTKSGSGILLCLFSVAAFAVHSYRKKEPSRLFVYIGIYSVIWGIAIFSQRYFAWSNLGSGKFLLSWYAGAALASVLLLFWYKDKDHSQTKSAPLGVHDFLMIVALSLGIWTCLWLLYWAYSINPQVIVQPILLISEALIPALVGLIVFKERRKFDSLEWAFAVIGLIGITLLAAGYR